MCRALFAATSINSLSLAVNFASSTILVLIVLLAFAVWAISRFSARERELNLKWQERQDASAARERDLQARIDAATESASAKFDSAAEEYRAKLDKLESEWRERERELVDRILKQVNVKPIVQHQVEKVVVHPDPEVAPLSPIDLEWRKVEIIEDIEHFHPELTGITAERLERDYAPIWQKYADRYAEAHTPLRASANA